MEPGEDAGASAGGSVGVGFRAGGRAGGDAICAEEVLELMIPPTRGWVAQWQSVPHVWGSPGFDPRSGLFFLFLQEERAKALGYQCMWPTWSLPLYERARERVEWQLELVETHKPLWAWLDGVVDAQAQTWLRVCAQEAYKVVHPKCGLERGLWPRRRQDYWWLIQIITPIARLPPELLHQILLIVIDNDNDSPLALVQVCKSWYDVVTDIWGSLKLGTTTPRNDITKKLKSFWMYWSIRRS